MVGRCVISSCLCPIHRPPPTPVLRLPHLGTFLGSPPFCLTELVRPGVHLECWHLSPVVRGLRLNKRPVLTLLSTLLLVCWTITLSFVATIGLKGGPPSTSPSTLPLSPLSSTLAGDIADRRHRQASPRPAVDSLEHPLWDRLLQLLPVLLLRNPGSPPREESALSPFRSVSPHAHALLSPAQTPA